MFNAISIVFRFGTNVLFMLSIILFSILLYLLCTINYENNILYITKILTITKPVKKFDLYFYELLFFQNEILQFDN